MRLFFLSRVWINLVEGIRRKTEEKDEERKKIETTKDRWKMEAWRETWLDENGNKSKQMTRQNFYWSILDTAINKISPRIFHFQMVLASSMKVDRTFLTGLFLPKSQIKPVWLFNWLFGVVFPKLQGNVGNELWVDVLSFGIRHCCVGICLVSFKNNVSSLSCIVFHELIWVRVHYMYWSMTPMEWFGAAVEGILRWWHRSQEFESG